MNGLFGSSSWLYILLVGFFVGLLGRFFMPGNNRMGCLLTIVLGISVRCWPAGSASTWAGTPRRTGRFPRCGGGRGGRAGRPAPVQRPPLTRSLPFLFPTLARPARPDMPA
jgi:hypothetical protein